MDGMDPMMGMSLLPPQTMQPMPGSMMTDAQCMVCGDRSAGKHYGVMACYGCKGFFRRTIRSRQTYTCRFQEKCSIDKDQRNACRYCRFRRCIMVGMEPDAIRPDRDIIGKQKNPRRKKLKQEDSSLPSPGGEESSQDDMLIPLLCELDITTNTGGGAMAASIACTPMIRVKNDPDFDISALFLNTHYRDTAFEMSYALDRVANVDDYGAAMRRYVIAASQWIDNLFQLSQVNVVHEKVLLLKAVFAPYALFSQAAKSAVTTDDADVLCLCNRSIMPRNLPRHLADSNMLSNNITARMLDELVGPIRKLRLKEAEIVVMSAMILLDAEAPGLSLSTSAALSQLRDRVQTALFQLCRESRTGLHAVTARFGNCLLLLPPLAKISSLLNENVLFAKMFGTQGLDPLIAELFTDSQNPEVIPSPPTRDKSDASTQTASQHSPALPSDLQDVHGDEMCPTSVYPDDKTPLEETRPAAYNQFYFGGATAPFSAPAYQYPPPQPFFGDAERFRFM